MKHASPKEITRPQVERIMDSVHGGDVYRESGGIVYKNGDVTKENNPAICGQVLALDWDSYEWDKVAALWVGMEIPKPAGYFDKCCNRCITEGEEKIEIPPLDFVAPSMANWANAFNIPVAVYQPKSPSKMGTFDYYDPTGQTTGINFYPVSSRAGIARKNPDALTASARQAIKYIKEREAQITQAWEQLAQDYAYQEQRCTVAAEQALGSLQTSEVRYQTALEKIKHYAGQTPRPVSCENWQNVHVVGNFNTQYQKAKATQAKQAAQVRNYLLSPSTEPIEIPVVQTEKIRVPIQAYSSWRE